MFRTIFEGTSQLAVYPIISLLLFLSIFVGVLVWVVRMDKPHLEYMRGLPLNDTDKRGAL